MSYFQSLLFDLDGTLVDSKFDLVDAVNVVLKNMGYPAQNSADIIQRIGNGLRQLLQDTLQIDQSDELLRAKQIFEDHYKQHCVDQTRPYHGVKETLDMLYGNFSMAVVTNKPKIFAEKILSELKLKQYFDVVIGGDSTSEAKPSPEPIKLALTSMGSTPDIALIIGDGHQDILAGHASGVKTCVAQYGFGYHPRLMALHPTFFIKEFTELKEILNVVNK